LLQAQCPQRLDILLRDNVPAAQDDLVALDRRADRLDRVARSLAAFLGALQIEETVGDQQVLDDLADHSGIFVGQVQPDAGGHLAPLVGQVVLADIGAHRLFEHDRHLARNALPHGFRQHQDAVDDRSGQVQPDDGPDVVRLGRVIRIAVAADRGDVVQDLAGKEELLAANPRLRRIIGIRDRVGGQRTALLGLDVAQISCLARGHNIARRDIAHPERHLPAQGQAHNQDGDHQQRDNQPDGEHAQPRRPRDIL